MENTQTTQRGTLNQKEIVLFSFDKSLKELHEKGIITFDTAISMARNVDELRSLIGKK